MGFSLAITIFAAAFLMQTAISIPVGDEETVASTAASVSDKDTVNSTLVDDLEDLCMCPKCYDPVCGSDNRTYANMCLFECAKEKRNPDLEIQFHGDCDGNQLTITLDDCNFSSEEDVQIDSKEKEDSKSASKEEDSKSTATKEDSE